MQVKEFVRKENDCGNAVVSLSQTEVSIITEILSNVPKSSSNVVLGESLLDVLKNLSKDFLVLKSCLSQGNLDVYSIERIYSATHPTCEED